MKLNKKEAVILHDLLMVASAWLLAWLSRFNFSIPFNGWEVSFYTLPLVLVTQALILWRFHLYKGLWRFASLPDLWNIFRAAILGSVSIILILFIFFRLEGVPRSVAILYPMYLMFLLGAPRMGYRLWKDHGLNLKNISNGPRVLLLGAGRGGEMLIREMLRTGSHIPVGILDDNPKLKGSEMHGVRVLGTIDRVSEMTEKHSANSIIIAIPSASNEQMQRIVNLCDKASVPIRTLPELDEMIGNNNPLSNLREVSIEDLLGREKVELDWKTLQSGVVNHTIMITGAGGSIGSELCHQIAALAPKEIVLYEQSEFNLYKIEKDLQKAFPNLILKTILGDVCDPSKIKHILTQEKPDLIFHAAAYKHVPMLEYQIREAIKNNVLGTKYMADAAAACGCKKFILISTDKAVNPSNILGKSKRLAEMYCEHLDKNSSTQFITVRFGNVLGSDGSVVPLFREQIKKGGPVTVTHPEVTRFFMTIPESCQLILQATTMGQGGEIFVLDMGKPIRIAYLAEQMIKLSGRTVHQEVKIDYIGLRPGEKMYEELFYQDEEQEKTTHNKIFLAKHYVRDNRIVMEKISHLEELCEDFSEDGIRQIVDELVPEQTKSENQNENVISIK